MIGPAMFVVALAALLTWGWWERRCWRRSEAYARFRASAEYQAFQEALTSMAVAIGEALTPAMRRAAVAFGEAAEAVERLNLVFEADPQ